MLKPSPPLKSQDVLVACKLFTLGDRSWTFAHLAETLFISLSEIHSAVERCRAAQLVIRSRDRETVAKKPFFELLAFAVPRIFYATRGSLEVGVVTGIQAPALAGQFDFLKDATPMVWPHHEGATRGESLLPLYPSVPRACLNDAALHELMALTDVVRVGETKHRKLAIAMLERKILGKAVD
jgi:hypothetical protein